VAREQVGDALLGRRCEAVAVGDGGAVLGQADLERGVGVVWRQRDAMHRLDGEPEVARLGEHDPPGG